MQTIILLAALAGLVWVIMTQGIETGLVAATFGSGVIWGGYVLLRRQRRLAGGLEGERAEPMLIDYARSFFPIFLVVLLLRSFVVEPFRIPSGSMMPSLLVGDFILVDKFSYGIRLPVLRNKVLALGAPERGDVAVFRFPQNERVDYIKRVVGLPGDRIAYRNKTLYINGEARRVDDTRPYEAEGSGVRANGSLIGQEDLGTLQHEVLINPFVPDFSRACTFLAYDEVEVPADHFFVMGDNRDDSNDSRCWGFVPEANLVGKAFVIWFSWDWQRSGYLAWDRLGNLIR